MVNAQGVAEKSLFDARGNLVYHARFFHGRLVLEATHHYDPTDRLKESRFYGSDGAPLRRAALGEVEVLEDAFVLCEEGRIVEVGRMRDLGALDGDVEEIDGRARCAVPGLVDCHTHVCFAGDRVHEFDLRARGASYEELHAAGGGILSTVTATRAAGEEALKAAVRRHREWMLHAGTKANVIPDEARGAKSTDDIPSGGAIADPRLYEAFIRADSPERDRRVKAYLDHFFAKYFAPKRAAAARPEPELR